MQEFECSSLRKLVQTGRHPTDEFLLEMFGSCSFPTSQWIVSHVHWYLHRKEPHVGPDLLLSRPTSERSLCCCDFPRPGSARGYFSTYQTYAKRQSNAKAISYIMQHHKPQKQSHLLELAAGETSFGLSFLWIWSFDHIDPVNPKNHVRIWAVLALKLSRCSFDNIHCGKADYPGFLDCSSPKTARHKPQQL
jgi:hypothetical protein